ncbi:hypothetical protein [Burkholderia ubonensis]|uniref:hypothetical protein n=1 Tax=Burkholderia ubonensis TaxID=101571 RepID=UPI0012BA67E8|nr:hypothetical protein [Burkholderia ubonensis]
MDASHAIIVWRYDKDGKARPVKSTSTTVMMVDPLMSTPADVRTILGPTAFYRASGSLYAWGVDPYSTTRRFEVVVNKSEIMEWPAIGVQGGRYYRKSGNLYLALMAYMTQEDMWKPDTCLKLQNETVTPPPPPISISVNAPDWNLGELHQGENIKKFSSVTEQLCFTYTGTAVSGKSFVIDASNVNGIADNTYRLRNLNDASQLVPYSVTLDSGSSTVSLPNMSNTALSLDSSGKTCFMPTFKASVGSSVKEGDYSDVLTFTVVTKS